MGARKNQSHQDYARSRIQASQLINRLTQHALGKVEMTASAVTAAIALIRKVVPDLAAIEHSGEVAQKHYVVSSEPLSDSAWNEKYGEDSQPTRIN